MCVWSAFINKDFLFHARISCNRKATIAYMHKFVIFGLKMMVKSGLENYFLNSFMPKPFSSNSFYILVLRKITNSVTKMTIFPHGGKSEIFLLQYVFDLIDLLEQKFYRDFNLRVKLMYESVK